MKVAADTGALISLELCGILKQSLEFFGYLIGEKIKDENMLQHIRPLFPL